MTLTQHGPKCDVCGNYILLDRSINPFGVKGIKGELHCHDKCKLLVEQCEGEWKRLPNGPLFKAFEYAMQKLDKQEEEPEP